MQNILVNLDSSKTRLFTLLIIAYLGVYVFLGVFSSGDAELILSFDPILLLVAQAVTSGVFFLLLPFLFWLYAFKQSAQLAFQKIDLISIGYVLLVAISAIFVISMIGAWNIAIDLPDSAFEEWAQAKEAELKILTQHMLTFTRVGHFIGSIFIIALIPAIGEELLFRGILQNLLAKISTSKHVGIWLSAFLFSAIHLQFYGFFPRMLLGALFGYLYVWSGRLSIAMLAHFLNNAIALCLVYIVSEEWVDTRPDELEQAAPWSAVIVFVVIGGFVLYKFKKYCMETSTN